MCGIFYYQTVSRSSCHPNPNSSNSVSKSLSTNKTKELFADFSKIQHRGPDNSQINKNYIGMESRGQFLEYWIKPDYINNYSTISASVNVSVSYKVLYSDDKTTPANKDAGTSHATTLIINPKGRSIVPEGIINEKSMNKYQK